MKTLCRKYHSFYTYKKKIYGLLLYTINVMIYHNFGKGSVIYRPLKVTGRKHIYIGDGVSFDKGLRMEAITWKDGQDFHPHIYIGNNTHAEQHCQIFSAMFLHIGNNVVISSDVYITDVEHDYKDINKRILEQCLKPGKTIIGDYSFLGTGVKIIKPVIIGEHVVVGANSVITKDIPSYSVVVGNPAKIIKKYNFTTKKWENTKE